MIGRVKFFDEARHFGFVSADDDGRDYYVAESELRLSRISGLDAGDLIEFEIAPGRDGKTRATRIKLLERA